jgi:septal ring-binding cell division protein DamX
VERRAFVNILIIGSLLGLAVLAILGAVLLGISEDRSDKAKNKLQAQQISASPLLPQQTQSQQTISQGPAFESVPATPLLSRQTITLPVASESGTIGSLSLASRDGQVREITGELRVLAQRAGELQQRLTSLSEALERQNLPRPEPPHTSFSSELFTSDTETQVF